MKIDGSFIVFILFAAIIWLAMHVYVWLRLVHAPRPQAAYGWTATGILIVLAGGFIWAMIHRRSPVAGWMGQVEAVFYAWMGLVFLLVIFFFFTDIIRLAICLLAPNACATEARKLFLSRTGACIVFFTALAFAAYAIRSAFSDVKVKDVSITLKRLPRELSGFLIVQLTDFHLGRVLGKSFLEDVVRKTNELNADLIAITGDLADLPIERLRDTLSPLKDLRSKYGVYLVTGNHEFYSGVYKELDRLKEFGVIDISNKRVSIGSGNASFDLAGIHDPSGDRFGGIFHPNLEKALEKRDPARELILLAHQPKAIFEAVHAGVGLQLSGHTHGGQIWPWGIFVMLSQPYISGLHDHEGAMIYVSRGTGFWGPPMRLFAPAEITTIRLLSQE